MTHFCAESETSGALAAGEEGASPEAHSRHGEKGLLSCRAWTPCPGTVPGINQPCNACTGQAQFPPAPESVQASQL